MTYRRAVVLRALGLGDLLTAVPALRGLRRGLGDGWRIELVTGPGLAQLAALTGAVDHVHEVEPFVLGPLDAVPPGPALAVNLHGRGPQSTERLRTLAPGRLVAFGNDAEWRDDEHEVARWCRLVRVAGVAPDADPADLRLPPPPAPPPRAGDRPQQTRREPQEGLRTITAHHVVVHPGAASAARRWPAERFAAVACELARGGHRVAVTGSAAERPLAERVATLAGLPAGAVLAGRTPLPELAGLVATARLVVCGDTGIAHLATAFGTPSVVLFGPTPPALWGPPAGDPRHRALWAGRTGDPHAGEVDPGLLAIEVEDVLAAAASALTP